MFAFFVSLLLVSAYNPYVRPLRATHAQKYQYPTMPFFGGFEWGDFEDYLPFMPRGQSSQSNRGQGQSAGRFSPYAPYMNNPYGLNMQKCMDNDQCSAWVNHSMFMGGRGGRPASSGAGSASPSSGNFGPSADTGSGADSGADSSTGGDSSASTGGDTASSGGDSGAPQQQTNGGGRFSFTPSMFGFPAGFNPMMYGLDWDARPVDCMDDSKCARGLMMFSGGTPYSSQAGGNGMFSFNLDPRVINYASQMFGFPTLQKPRRLRRAHYGVPYHYGY